ncbi:hypothetical protein HYH03_008040 [Edaphochlamys debaryana]|uniref:Guanylate cyclase domain-containing protein n=1 Tax=Edaphochlamys debaryana TaxID=47281 RepID=A0A835Y256_9CHLO|nr:hypothetical protein HYH03_008040 [Edaphochlamys debaryana]|eukprot:KAG2493822.1 hypothetical protein HYH03_008040 [Edaphochlamys debaryana]
MTRGLQGALQVPMQVDTLPVESLLNSFTLTLPESAANPGPYDYWMCSAEAMGDAVAKGAFLDLTNLILNDRTMQATDIPTAWRSAISSAYAGVVNVLPVGAYIHHLYYRKDVFAAMNLSVPHTWDETIALAARFHGQQINGPTRPPVMGLCFASSAACDLSGLMSLIVLSSIVQLGGPPHGAVFDPEGLQPLFTGSAMREALRIVAALRRFSVPDNATCTDHYMAHVSGRCFMTIGWAMAFKLGAHRAVGSPMRGRQGVTSLPGSSRVLDRTTGQLVECASREQCPFAEEVPQDPAQLAAAAAQGTPVSPTRLVNKILHFDSLSIAINAYSPPAAQAAAYVALTSFLAPAVHKRIMFAPTSELTPVRMSELVDADWVAAGYEETDTAGFLAEYRRSLGMANVMFELRIPGASQFLRVIESMSNAYLLRNVSFEQASADALSATEILITVHGGHAAVLRAYRASISYAPPPPPPPVAAAPQASEDGPPIGLIVGLAVGGGVLVAAGLAAWAVLRVRRRRRAAAALRSTAPGACSATSLLVTDIQDSTSLWESLPAEVMDVAVRSHHATMRRLLVPHQGYESATEGDSFILAFWRSADALAFALAAQEAMLGLAWDPALCASPWAPTLAVATDAAALRAAARCFASGGSWLRGLLKAAAACAPQQQLAPKTSGDLPVAGNHPNTSQLTSPDTSTYPSHYPPEAMAAPAVLSDVDLDMDPDGDLDLFQQARTDRPSKGSEPGGPLVPVPVNLHALKATGSGRLAVGEDGGAARPEGPAAEIISGGGKGGVGLLVDYNTGDSEASVDAVGPRRPRGAGAGSGRYGRPSLVREASGSSVKRQRSRQFSTAGGFERASSLGGTLLAGVAQIASAAVGAFTPAPQEPHVALTDFHTGTSSADAAPGGATGGVSHQPGVSSRGGADEVWSGTLGELMRAVFPKVEASVASAGLCGEGPAASEQGGGGQACAPGELAVGAGGGTVVLRGLRIRMGVHSGVGPREVSLNAASQRVVFSGAALVAAKAVGDVGAGGQVILSADTVRQLSAKQLSSGAFVVLHAGRHELKGAGPTELYTAFAPHLLPRLGWLPAPRSEKVLVPGALAAPVGRVAVAVALLTEDEALTGTSLEATAAAHHRWSGIAQQLAAPLDGYLVVMSPGTLAATFVAPAPAARWLLALRERLTAAREGRSSWPGGNQQAAGAGAAGAGDGGGAETAAEEEMSPEALLEAAAGLALSSFRGGLDLAPLRVALGGGSGWRPALPGSALRPALCLAAAAEAGQVLLGEAAARAMPQDENWATGHITTAAAAAALRGSSSNALSLTGNSRPHSHNTAPTHRPSRLRMMAPAGAAANGTGSAVAAALGSTPGSNPGSPRSKSRIMSRQFRQSLSQLQRANSNVTPAARMSYAGGSNSHTGSAGGRSMDGRSAIGYGIASGAVGARDGAVPSAPTSSNH